LAAFQQFIRKRSTVVALLMHLVVFVDDYFLAALAAPKGSGGAEKPLSLGHHTVSAVSSEEASQVNGQCLAKGEAEKRVDGHFPFSIPG
jgi:hypothetical protein